MADKKIEQDKWKHKYLESLEELERKEANWRETDQLLRRGLSRIALISHGVDDTLDTHLKKLRTALQNNADAEVINGVVEQISRYMKTLDEQRAAHATLPEPAEVLLQAVVAVDFPSSVAQPLNQLKIRLVKPDASSQIQSLIEEFSRLLALAFYGGQPTPTAGNEPAMEQSPEPSPKSSPESSPEPSDEEKRGWLQRVFNREGGRNGKGQVVEPATADLPQTAPPAAAFTPPLPQPEPTPVRLEQALVAEAHRRDATIEDVFLDILESLNFPPQFLPRVQQLKEALTKGLSADGIKGMTESVVALVVEMRTALEREKGELENFLQQLTQRLNELDAMVAGAESGRVASVAGGRKFEAAVKAQVTDIETTMQGSTELTQMKSAIQVSLEKIRQHLAEQRQQEESYQASLEEQLRGMTAKFKQLEGESQKLRSRLAEERVQALTDPLTGAPNRLAYEQRVAQEFARWQRYKNPITMVVCDVDHFKKINDTYGHKAGDRALMAIVKTMKFHLRETDFLARIGGEEFVILLAETTQGDAEKVAEKLRRSVELSEFVYQGQPVPVTISGGFSQFHPGDTVDEVYIRADKALYRAKNAGRNRFMAAN